MLSKVAKATLTPLQSLSPPRDASPSLSQSPVPTPRTTHAPPQIHHASVPPQAKVQPPSHTSSAPPTGVARNLMHKNDLNCYCQRLGIPLPVYQTAIEVEGCAHALRFRATVSVGKKIFTSPNTFANRRSAEQDAANLALQNLLNEDAISAINLRGLLRKLVWQDKARCKMILNEFLAKIKMECTYETVQVQMPPVFVSSLALNGTCYRGEGGKNKKEAEQIAALAAILSLLDDPTYATTISEVIKSKFNACAIFNQLKEFPDSRDCPVTAKEFKAATFTQQASLIGQSSFRVLIDEKMSKSVDLQANCVDEQGGSGILINKNQQDLVNSLPQTEKEVNKNQQDLVNSLPQTEKEVNKNQQDLVNSLPQTEKEVDKNQQDLLTSLPQAEKQNGEGVLDDNQGVAGHPPGAVTISRHSYVSLPITSPSFSEPQHEIKLPPAAQLASQQIEFPVESVPSAAQKASQQIGVPIGFVPAAAQNPAYDSISSKKKKTRRKNKKKANKRLRAENK